MLDRDEMHIIAQLEERIDALEEKVERLNHRISMMIFQVASTLTTFEVNAEQDK